MTDTVSLCLYYTYLQCLAFCVLRGIGVTDKCTHTCTHTCTNWLLYASSTCAYTEAWNFYPIIIFCLKTSNTHVIIIYVYLVHLQIQSTTTYYPITMPAGLSVIVISVVLIFMGVVEPILFLANFIFVYQVEHRQTAGMTFLATAAVSFQDVYECILKWQHWIL